MELKIVVDIAIVVFFVVAGFSQIAKGTIYINREKYTNESVRAFSKPMGLITWLFAVALALIFIGQASLLSPKLSTYLEYIGDAAVVLTIVIYFFASSKILVKKKETMKYTYKNKKRKY